MSIKVHLSPTFYDIVDKKTTLEAHGRTVRAVIEDIDRRYPGFKNECIDQQGKLHDFLEIYINKTSAFPDELNHSVSDNDEIAILTVLGGG